MYFEITFLHVRYNSSLTLQIFYLTNELETGSNLEILAVEKISAMETSGKSSPTVYASLLLSVQVSQEWQGPVHFQFEKKSKTDMTLAKSNTSVSSSRKMFWKLADMNGDGFGMNYCVSIIY